MSSSERGLGRPIVPGIVGGVVAYVVGFVLTYLWVANRVRDALEGVNAIVEFFGGDPIPIWKAVGWVFYNAHFVPLTHPGLAGGESSRNFVQNGDLTVALVLVPILVILLAGVGVGWYAATDVRDGALSGVVLMLGYLPLSVFGIYLFQVARAGAVVGPDDITGILLAGLLFPVVFGGLGGALGSYLHDEYAGMTG